MPPALVTAASSRSRRHFTAVDSTISIAPSSSSSSSNPPDTLPPRSDSSDSDNSVNEPRDPAVILVDLRTELATLGVLLESLDAAHDAEVQRIKKRLGRLCRALTTSFSIEWRRHANDPDRRPEPFPLFLYNALRDDHTLCDLARFRFQHHHQSSYCLPYLQRIAGHLFLTSYLPLAFYFGTWFLTSRFSCRVVLRFLRRSHQDGNNNNASALVSFHTFYGLAYSRARQRAADNLRTPPHKVEQFSGLVHQDNYDGLTFRNEDIVWAAYSIYPDLAIDHNAIDPHLEASDSDALLSESGEAEEADEAEADQAEEEEVDEAEEEEASETGEEGPEATPSEREVPRSRAVALSEQDYSLMVDSKEPSLQSSGSGEHTGQAVEEGLFQNSPRSRDTIGLTKAADNVSETSSHWSLLSPLRDDDDDDNDNKDDNDKGNEDEDGCEDDTDIRLVIDSLPSEERTHSRSAAHSNCSASPLTQHNMSPSLGYTTLSPANYTASVDALGASSTAADADADAGNPRCTESNKLNPVKAKSMAAKPDISTINLLETSIPSADRARKTVVSTTGEGQPTLVLSSPSSLLSRATSLLGTSWVRDDAISALLSFVTVLANRQSPERRTEFIPSVTTSAASTSCPARRRNSPILHRWCHAARLLMPMHVSGNHWVLVV
ncbi:hypothetical protein GGR56DRAFT_152706 [Xylariaceae sp. FL0804]|nr:hypothetical protein GGR56DRAFT_152706 [Xylariaceae sp. FL0804]